MIIKKYLSREVFNTLFVVVSVLLIAFLCQQLVRYLNYVAIGKIPTNLLLELVSFEIPYLLALLLPLGLYLGILLAYGRLQTDNEMVIMQMSGYNNRRIMRLTVTLAASVSVFVLFLMLVLNPQVFTKRQQLMSSDEATLHLIQTLIPGRFQVSADGNHVMYVEKMSRDHERAKNVFVAEARKNEKEPDQDSWMLVLADQGYQVKDRESSDQFFVTTDGYRYEGVPGQNDYKITQYKKYKVRIPQADPRASHHESETLPTWQLLQEYDQPKQAAELQWRISMGITTFLLAMLAVPLSNLRPRQSRYLMLLPAVVLYMIYFNLLVTARHWLEQGTVPIALGMWWVHGIVILFILIMLFVTHGKKLQKS